MCRITIKMCKKKILKNTENFKELQKHKRTLVERNTAVSNEIVKMKPLKNEEE